MFKKWWAFVLVGILAAAGSGCTNFPSLTGGNDNSTDAVEQFIPDDITLDISELPNTDSQNAKAHNADATISGSAAYDRSTRAGSRVMNMFQGAAQRSMALAAVINGDMESADVTEVYGDFMVNSTTVNYRADFAAFDFDGDNIADGSGNAVTEPIALRVWVDRGDGFERFLCALVTTKPTTANLGKGALYCRPAAARSTEYTDLMVYTQWDRTEANHKWNLAWVTGQLGENYSFDNAILRVDHRTDGDVTGKTVRATTMFSDSPYGFDTFSMAGHWQAGSGAMLLHAQASGGITDLNFDEICVALDDLDTTDSTLCNDFDTQDMNYLDAADGTETAWPADFPAEPTFTPTTTAS
ncbi:MAG: hypothetical protein H6819_00400 [Phycisphaerales bacterium]|nr:hypothetical protein [Phycisphaerales bacterium]MCB9857331.1 hypothetical protein [Phycisphaerales bacterium]MCB9862955.1 hypothetical protein [Phycisphaerales bacterium]